MKIFSYTSFCWIMNIVLSVTLSDEELSLFCTSFLFLFLVSNMSLKSFGNLSYANHASKGNSITHLTLYFLAFPSFFVWIEDSLHNLVFGILWTEWKMSTSMRSHEKQTGNWQQKDFTYTFAKCWFVISCIFLLSKFSMMSDVMLPLGCQLSL